MFRISFILQKQEKYPDLDSSKKKKRIVSTKKNLSKKPTCMCLSRSLSASWTQGARSLGVKLFHFLPTKNINHEKFAIFNMKIYENHTFWNDDFSRIIFGEFFKIFFRNWLYTTAFVKSNKSNTHLKLFNSCKEKFHFYSIQFCHYFLGYIRLSSQNSNDLSVHVYFCSACFCI